MPTPFGSTLGLLALAGVVIGSGATAQAPAAESKSAPVDYRDAPTVWGYGSIGGPYDGSSKRALPPAIVPTAWLVVPRASKADEEQLLTRFALECDAPLPTATNGASGDAKPSSTAKGAAPVEWLAVESKEPKDALLAFTTITSESDDVRMAQLTGAELLFVNGEGFAGDVERLGFRGVPVLLKKGANRLFVAGIRESFTLELWKPATRMVIGTWDAAWPGYGMPYDAFEDDFVTYPVFNASNEYIELLHLTFGHGAPAECTRPLERTEWRDGASLAPLGMLLCGHEWRPFDGWVDPNSPCPWTAETRAELAAVELRSDVEGDADFEVLRRELARPRELDDKFRSRDAASRPKSLIARRSFPIALVYGTQGTAEETAALLAEARLDQQLAWARTRGTPLLLSDVQYATALLRSERDEQNSVTPVHVRDAQVVVYGNADTNAAWSSVVPPALGLDVRRTGVTRGTTRIEGTDIFGWFLCAKDEAHRARANAVVFSTGASTARSGSLLHPFAQGIVPLDDALFRRDEFAPHGRIAFPATAR